MNQQQTIQKLATDALSARHVAAVRELLWAAFAHDEDGAFGEDDWQHALGGTHFIAIVGDEIVAHAAVVERALQVAGIPVRTGYVEAVAAAPTRQGQGHGTALMREVDTLIARDFELGVLGTGSQGFYERLGWRIWRGPSSVRTDTGEVPTPDEDGYIMAMRTPTSPVDLSFEAPISCEWRPGDVW